MHDLCKACVDYMKFGLVYYLIPNQGLEGGFQRLENDWDVLDMCNIGFVDVANDVHVHFKHVVDEMLEIIPADVLENVIGGKNDAANCENEVWFSLLFNT